jgi:hypothetical protein
MLENILNAVKGDLGKNLLDQFNLDADKVDDTVETTGSTIKDVVMSEVTGGNIGGLLDLFKQKDEKSISSNPIAQTMVRQLVGNLVSKLGLNKALADKISVFAVPFIVKFVADRFDKDVEGDDENSLLDMLGGEGIGDLLGNLTKGKGGLLGGLGKLFGGK